MRSPNPNGKWPNLEMVREANYSGWAGRIRSLRVGPAATVTAFTQPEFRGQSEQYRAETDHPRLSPEFSASIQSLEIVCRVSPNTDIKR